MSYHELLAKLLENSENMASVIGELSDIELSNLYDKCCDGIPDSYDREFRRKVVLYVDIQIAYRWQKIIKEET